MIERKEDMGKRGLESPDRADTLMLTYAVDPAPKPVAPRLDPVRYRANDPRAKWME